MEHSVMGNCQFFRETKNPRCSEWSTQLWEIVKLLQGKPKIRGVQNGASSYGKLLMFLANQKIRDVQNGAFSYVKLSNFHRENRKSEVFRIEHSVMGNCQCFRETKNPRCSE